MLPESKTKILAQDSAQMLRFFRACLHAGLVDMGIADPQFHEVLFRIAKEHGLEVLES